MTNLASSFKRLNTTLLGVHQHHIALGVEFYEFTRELPGVALVNILNWQFLMGKGNSFSFLLAVTEVFLPFV